MARLMCASVSDGFMRSASRNASAAPLWSNCSSRATPRLFARYASSRARTSGGCVWALTAAANATVSHVIRESVTILTLSMHHRPRIDHTFAFLHRDRLVRVGTCDGVDAAARPSHVDLGDPWRVAEAERQRKLALRAVTGAGLDQLPLACAAGEHDLDACANPVAVRLRADGLDAQRVPAIAAVVTQQARGPVILGNKEIEIPIVVVVGICRASTDDRPAKRGTEL